jgi:hypothetical protein
MNQAKAATVVSALVTAGYVPAVSLDSNGQYRVSVANQDGVTAATVQTFATAQGVTANVHSVDFT